MGDVIDEVIHGLKAGTLARGFKVSKAGPVIGIVLAGFPRCSSLKAI
jgi:hypothetical protein